MAAGAEDELIETLVELADKPLDFVLWAFPWGEPGTELATRAGPIGWQTRALEDLQAEYARSREAGLTATSSLLKSAYQAAVRSGHDVGKSAFASWLMLWAISTRVDTRGRATANTEKQLRTILWGELAKWHRLFIGNGLFKMTATAIYSADPSHEKNWRIDAIPWSEDNPEAFAGLHNYGGRIIVLFDEASAIMDKIWEVTDGVTHEADTEIIWIATGNPTRNYGRFFECFHRFESQWRQYKVDSREVPFANVEKINQSIEIWGLDSDYVKVRYLGDFPSSSTTQLIPYDIIVGARHREAQSYHYEPLIMGVDVARFGSNESVVVFRRGKDARTIPALRWRGLSVTDLGGRVGGLIGQHSPDAVFIDEGGVGGGVVDFCRYLGYAVTGVNFGVPASTRPQGTLVGNKRAEMYMLTLQSLRDGLAIENSDELQEQLITIEYFYNKKQEIMLVSKEDMAADGVESPDWADALALTFAYAVNGKAWLAQRPKIKVDYDPLAQDRLPSAKELYETPTLGRMQ